MSFHDGELQVQTRAGVLREARRVGQMLQTAIPASARAFLAGRRFAVLSAATVVDRVWASVLVGPRGFLEASEDGTRLDLAARLRDDDPLAPAIRAGTGVGLLAIDFAARRRYRVNGTVLSIAAGFTLEVREAFGNCPKYISTYTPRPDQPPVRLAQRHAARLDDRQRRWVEQAETFFLGTVHPEAGPDASHRGGAAGFVRVTGPQELIWGDYPGNNLFNSLGNAAVDPRAGLLFLEPETGSTLQLSGRLQIDWSPEAAAAIPGAERILRFTIEEGVETPGAITLRWAHGESSPFSPPAR